MKTVGDFRKTAIIGGLFVLVPWAPTPFAGSVRVVQAKCQNYWM